MHAAALSRFRASEPACELALYADIGAGTVLASDGALRYPQELLDALLACATLIFAHPFAAADVPFDHAVFSTPTGLRVFVRIGAHADEVLCCICAPTLDLEAFLTEARRFTASLVEEPNPKTGAVG